MKLYTDDDIYYINCDLRYEQNLRNKWEDEKITVKAIIERGNDRFGPYHFFLTPSEYNNFKAMKGTFTGFSLTDNDIVINLLPTDIIYIESDNYNEIKEKFDTNYKEKMEKYRKEQTAYREKKKKEKEEKAEREKISKEAIEEVKEEDKEEVKEEVKEENKEENKPWYKKIIKFLKELFK